MQQQNRALDFLEPVDKDVFLYEDDFTVPLSTSAITEYLEWDVIPSSLFVVEAFSLGFAADFAGDKSKVDVFFYEDAAPLYRQSQAGYFIDHTPDQWTEITKKINGSKLRVSARNTDATAAAKIFIRLKGYYVR